MTTLLFGGSALLAFALAAALTPLVARLAQRAGMLDIPGGRRLHPRLIPRPGGLAIARPPGRGIGRGCRRRPPGMSSMPARWARRATSGVSAAARANASNAEPPKRRVVMALPAR